MQRCKLLIFTSHFININSVSIAVFHHCRDCQMRMLEDMDWCMKWNTDSSPQRGRRDPTSNGSQYVYTDINWRHVPAYANSVSPPLIAQAFFLLVPRPLIRGLFSLISDIGQLRLYITSWYKINKVSKYHEAVWSSRFPMWFPWLELLPLHSLLACTCLILRWHCKGNSTIFVKGD